MKLSFLSTATMIVSLLAFVMVVSIPLPSYALPAKAQVVVTTAVYGAVGGAILGMASLAYGTSFKSIAMGASLGLYAGLLFGGYLLGSHYYYKQIQQGPSDGDSDSGGEVIDSSTVGSDSVAFHHQSQNTMLMDLKDYRHHRDHQGRVKFQGIPLFVPLIQVSF